MFQEHEKELVCQFQILFFYQARGQRPRAWYKKLTDKNCTYYAEASEEGGEFSWAVRLSVGTQSPPRCLDLAA